MRLLVILLTIIVNINSYAQVNIQNLELDFGNPVNPSASVGSTTKYDNVITVDGTSYDALVEFVSITSQSELDELDNTSTTQGNLDRYFSPRFTWPNNGGEAVFEISFIMDDTEDNPVYVTFFNFLINTYDLDGGVSGSGAAGQFNSFSNFESYSVSENSLLTVTEEGNFTKFQSAQNQSTSVSDIEAWAMVSYSQASSFQIKMGASGDGAAYYYIDFSLGLFDGYPNIQVVNNNTTPIINSFNPISTCTNDTIYISGENFSSIDSIYIGGIISTDFLVQNDNSMWVITPEYIDNPTNSIQIFNGLIESSINGFSLSEECSFGGQDPDPEPPVQNSDSQIITPLQEVCEDGTLTLDLNNLQSVQPDLIFQISQNLNGFASAQIINGSIILDFSNEGTGTDTLIVNSIDEEFNVEIKIPVIEYGNPVLDSYHLEAATGPKSPDGAIHMTFLDDYESSVTLNILGGFSETFDNNLVNLPSGTYWIEGFTNSKGCFTEFRKRAMVPYVRCDS